MGDRGTETRGGVAPGDKVAGPLSSGRHALRWSNTPAASVAAVLEPFAGRAAFSPAWATGTGWAVHGFPPRTIGRVLDSRLAARGSGPRMDAVHANENGADPPTRRRH